MKSLINFLKIASKVRLKKKKISIKNSKYYQKHKVRLAEKWKNDENRKKYLRWYYQENKEVIIKKAAEWQKDNPERRSENLREWNDKLVEENGALVSNQDRMKSSRLKKAYGITLEDKNQMIKDQDGYCYNPFCLVKLSDIPERHVHVDHDHETGEVRCIMCNACNTNLGKIEKNMLRFKGLMQIAEENIKRTNER